MRERLIDDPASVSALAGRVADEHGIPLLHVEKDFWVTEVLRGVTARAEELGIDVLFKGGTSLSKVFSMIHRFSEDVDMLVLLPPDTRGADDRKLKDLVEGAAACTGIAADVDTSSATKGVKRAARFHYPTVQPSGGGLSEGVLLELGTRGGALMSVRAEVRSLIATHVPEVEDLPEAQPVLVRVMSPWRTLVEKLVLLHTAHCAEAPTAAVRGARHLYDVHQLLQRNEVLAGVAEAGVVPVARDVCTYSRAAGLPAEDRPSGGFAVSPAFNNGPHTAAAQEEYERRVVAELLWPGAAHPTFEDCIAAVQQHADTL